MPAFKLLEDCCCSSVGTLVHGQYGFPLDLHMLPLPDNRLNPSVELICVSAVHFGNNFVNYLLSKAATSRCSRLN